MILIADSGSTKTDWCLIDKGTGKRLEIDTQGINPIHMSSDQISTILADGLLPALKDKYDSSQELKMRDVLQVYFYGAGCTAGAGERISTALSNVLKEWKLDVEVNSDLLGAARALCGKNAGIACILGTGANSCLYDGEKIVDNVPPLGYILGDEGSGAVLGKLFFNSMFKRRLPQNLSDKYLQECQLTYADVIDRIYRQPLANRFLASTSVCIKQHLHECEELRCMVVDNFREFFRKNVSKYIDTQSQRPTAHFVGSMAWAYEEQLREAAQEEKIEIGTILKSPMQGLVEFHLI